jgi:hypothetical protein
MDNGITGNGNVISQERTVEGFNGIVLDGLGNINVHFSENYKVVVTTDSNILDYVIIKTNGNILHIDENSNTNGYSPTKLLIDVYMPEIKSIKLSGLGNITMDNGDGENIEINLGGIGDIDISNYKVKK